MTTKETLEATTQFFTDLLISVEKGQFCLDNELFPPETRDITSTLETLNTIVIDAFGDTPENLMAQLVAKKAQIDGALETI